MPSSSHRSAYFLALWHHFVTYCLVWNVLFSCSKGDLPVVRVLIEEYKVNPECADNDGQTPLHHVCRYVPPVRQTMATTKTETTRGHWLEHHEHSSSSAKLTKTGAARWPTRTQARIIIWMQLLLACPARTYICTSLRLALQCPAFH